MFVFQGLVRSKQKLQPESHCNSSVSQDAATTLGSPPAEERNKYLVKADEEACPVCQEKLSNQKMVFQCGHVTCCKCNFLMTFLIILLNGLL